MGVHWWKGLVLFCKLEKQYRKVVVKHYKKFKRKDLGLL